MLGDLPSASHLSFVAVSWLRRDSDPFVAGEVYSYRGAVELDEARNREADDCFAKSLELYGEGFPEQRQILQLQRGLCKELRGESGRKEFLAVYAEVFHQPVFNRPLREKAAINLCLCDVYYHDVVAAERRLKQLPPMLPDNELWRSFALGLIKTRHGDLSPASQHFREAAAGFLKRENAMPWSFVLLHACQVQCQLGEWPVADILAATEVLATSNLLRGKAAQAAEQLHAACNDRKLAARMIGLALSNLRCPHAVSHEGQQTE
jgi:hypothetical protein